MGPCLCGDTHCASCGPAQGNWRCPICRAWADDGCDHIDWNEETGEASIKPEHQAEVDRLAKEEAEAEDALVRELEEAERQAAAYFNKQDPDEVEF